MLAELRAAVVLLLAFTLLTGVAYPLLVTGVAQAAFPRQANGSLDLIEGKVVGSSLVGQPFDAPEYFWSRPSATPDANGKPLPYNAQSSYASNLGPTNPALIEAVTARVAALRAANAAAPADHASDGPVPVDLVTASGSGLDPHISPAAALYQVPRVAAARGRAEEELRALVAKHTDGRSLGVLGEPGVNVLELNLDLGPRR